MLFTIYTKFLNDEPVCHGTIECPSEHEATVYAYEIACRLFSAACPAEMAFDDFHDALFSNIEFWIE